MNGIACSFCHFPHKRGRRKNKLRPCKGKRDRYRKLVSRLTTQIAADPDSFNLETVELPPSIASNEVVKSKLMTKMQLHAEQARDALCPEVQQGESAERKRNTIVSL